MGPRADGLVDLTSQRRIGGQGYGGGRGLRLSRFSLVLLSSFIRTTNFQAPGSYWLGSSGFGWMLRLTSMNPFNQRGTRRNTGEPVFYPVLFWVPCGYSF